MVQLRPRNPQLNIANVFLKEFTRQLIINSTPVPKVDPELIERVKQKLQDHPARDILLPSIKLQSLPVPALRRQIANQGLRGFSQSKQIQGKMMIAVPKQTAQVHPLRTATGELINVGKLSAFLSDPSVTGVECPGPDKNVLVNKSGIVQAVPTTMKADEIEIVLKEFSEKTKIPLLPGVFKALYNNLLITAVISDIVGNRFIIEKHFGKVDLPRKEDK